MTRGLVAVREWRSPRESPKIDPMSESEPPEQPEAPRAARVGRSGPSPLLVGFVAFVLGGLAMYALGGGASESPAPDDAAEAAPLTYTCSMHPNVQQPDPGSCPICGMDLIVADPNAGAALGDDEVELSARARALARIRTVPVERLSGASSDLRLLGRVEVDESRRRAVTAWVGGRVDSLLVRETGESIRRGQVVARMYSPEVYAAAQELLAARRGLARLGSSASELARRAAEATLAAARERLRLLGVPNVELERMEREERPSRNVAVRSPSAGRVLERLVDQGAYVEPGQVLFRVADLSRVWVVLEAYERDLELLSEGQHVELEVEALSDDHEPIAGRIGFIEPVLDDARRIVHVRVEVDNAAGELRPGMFAEALVHATSPEQRPLVVPASAPLFTGERALVYVEGAEDEQGRTRYAARVVRLGPRLGESYPVLAGLREGERVVARGAFALDADLQIRGGHSMMARPDERASEFGEILEVPPSFHEGMAPIAEAYLDLAQRLAADDPEGAQTATRRMQRALAEFTPSAPAESVEVWGRLRPLLVEHTTRVAEAEDIDTMRSLFEHLSAYFATSLRVFGNPLDSPIHLAFCPMAFNDRGAEWFQRDDIVDNAYFGALMRTCGEIRTELEPGQHLLGGPVASELPLAGED